MPKHQLSPELKAFLTDWLHWAENGAPENGEAPYWRAYGLCLSLTYYSGPRSGDYYYRRRIGLDLQELLTDTAGSCAYPFTNLGQHIEDDVHLNPKRLAWVKAQLVEGTPE